MPEFTRPKEGLRYNYGGMRLSQVPDALPPTKYPVGINIRSLRESSVQTRPGMSLRFDTGAGDPITDICTFANIFTDNKPRVIARDASDAIWLNPASGTTGVALATMSGSGSGKGAAMIPFRPNASPTPYMYIANGSDYQKFSAPDSLDAVVQSNVGIAEPIAAPDAALLPVLNTTSGPTVETLRPTTFNNPDGSAPVPGSNNPFLNPGDAIDGSGVTFATGIAKESTTPQFSSSCLWFGIPAASVTYSSLVLKVIYDTLPFVLGTYIATIEVSLDGGASFPLSTFHFSGEPFAGPIPGTDSFTLSPTQDLTLVQVRCRISSPFAGAAVADATVNIFDIRTEGRNAVGFFDQTGVAADWTQGGTAGAPSDVGGPNDNAVAVIADPLNPNVYSIGYQFVASPPSAWQVGQTMIQGPNPYLLLDSMQPAISAQISAIYYFTGTSGRCIIVPENLPVSTVANFTGNNPQAKNFLDPSAIAALRRGAILFLGGTEYVYVLSVTIGPDNTICIETTTTGTFIPTDTIVAQPTMIVYGTVTPTTGGNDLTSPLITSSVTTGTGTLTRTVAFFQDISSITGLQDADYIHGSFLVDAPQSLTEIVFEFDVGDGTFTQDFYYYSIRPSDLSNFLAGTASSLAAAQTTAQRAAIDALDPSIANNRGSTLAGNQLGPGASQRTEVLFPIQALTRVGTGSQTLVDTVAVRITVICTATVQLSFGSLSTWGGSQPDVGQTGSPYFYRVRPRSKLTGVVGNPSPSTRYGVSPLRFCVTLALPSAAYDGQIDTWDIFRYGGSVLSWRYIGSTDSGNPTFIDNFSDDAALAGDALEFDNFQPWPSIDLPNNGTASQVVGTVAVVTSDRADILDYLPGTIVQLAGQNAYTLITRPTLLATDTYLLQFIENAGALSLVPFSIQEPVIAQRRLPYMWGPDASGTVFACGDQLRPGTLYFAKNYAPDSAPDNYNIEVVEPGEPLLGGEILDGLSFVGSAERWWALYPTPDNPAQRFNPVQQPFLRGLAAPYGHCNDGQSLYWWAKDGIQSSTKGSLTDADLYNLFPHEGVVGKSVTYGPYTFKPPDYSHAGTFRLAYDNYYLYAIYQDSESAYHCLVLDTRRGSWAEDRYSPTVPCMFHPGQQAGTLLTNTTRYDELLMGTSDGRVAAQAGETNDLDGAIDCAIASFEYPGEDVRAPKQWGDVYVDVEPASLGGITVTPMSGGAGVATPTVVPQSSRVQRAVSVGGVIISQFLGLLAQWTDDFDDQDEPTQLHLWQPSFAVQPAKTLAFVTFGSSYGVQGFMHIQELAIAYVSTAPVTVTITSYDGQSPAALVIPSTAGAYQKAIFQLTANKGQLYRFAWSSAAEFQVFLDDCEIHVGAWGRIGPYEIKKDMGGIVNAAAAI